MLNALLVEDDVDLATAVIDYFEMEDISCDHAVNGVIGLNLIEKNRYQVIVLDLNLPLMNGLNVCKKMREQGIDTPVLMLTAMDTLNDKLTGFDHGADDYLVKPFAVEELVARVLALSKRKSGQVTKLQVAGIELDLAGAQAFHHGTALKISPTEFKILEVLLRNSPNPVSRERIFQEVWGDDQPESNSLKVHIFNLRKQLAKAGDKNILRTVPNVGFAIGEPISL
ncbi:response regulator transcription factor [Reinekea marinisedimentorum]|uniref:DNA-binding response OmpR family regulator n=1 Tax=Reinekea marinisedimentorum TaxID=230495 RepID=A0A4R3ICP1_9GAMM|nr:response regulator transcription factor [Reinekea marinisedimentorum]TCS43336.1 DNA-binding response OmpR family regulator [Reinekea marinisedimentorum]